ncbi:MAG: hypothetical protein M1837_003498 [Sclerophora amabilis]|nr:MAG: hypothetical protein M1837_003498 [Sclerophora amabilis]
MTLQENKVSTGSRPGSTLKMNTELKDRGQLSVQPSRIPVPTAGMSLRNFRAAGDRPVPFGKEKTIRSRIGRDRRRGSSPTTSNFGGPFCSSSNQGNNGQVSIPASLRTARGTLISKQKSKSPHPCSNREYETGVRLGNNAHADYRTSTVQPPKFQEPRELISRSPSSSRLGRKRPRGKANTTRLLVSRTSPSPSPHVLRSCPTSHSPDSLSIHEPSSPGPREQNTRSPHWYPLAPKASPRKANARDKSGQNFAFKRQSAVPTLTLSPPPIWYDYSEPFETEAFDRESGIKVTPPLSFNANLSSNDNSDEILSGGDTEIEGALPMTLINPSSREGILQKNGSLPSPGEGQRYRTASDISVQYDDDTSVIQKAAGATDDIQDLGSKCVAKTPDFTKLTSNWFLSPQSCKVLRHRECSQTTNPARSTQTCGSIHMGNVRAGINYSPQTLEHLNDTNTFSQDPTPNYYTIANYSTRAYAQIRSQAPVRPCPLLFRPYPTRLYPFSSVEQSKDMTSPDAPKTIKTEPDSLILETGQTFLNATTLLADSPEIHAATQRRSSSNGSQCYNEWSEIVRHVKENPDLVPTSSLDRIGQFGWEGHRNADDSDDRSVLVGAFSGLERSPTTTLSNISVDPDPPDGNTIEGSKADVLDVGHRFFSESVKRSRTHPLTLTSLAPPRQLQRSLTCLSPKLCTDIEAGSNLSKLAADRIAPAKTREAQVKAPRAESDGHEPRYPSSFPAIGPAGLSERSPRMNASAEKDGRLEAPIAYDRNRAISWMGLLSLITSCWTLLKFQRSNTEAKPCPTAEMHRSSCSSDESPGLLRKVGRWLGLRTTPTPDRSSAPENAVALAATDAHHRFMLDDELIYSPNIISSPQTGHSELQSYFSDDTSDIENQTRIRTRISRILKRLSTPRAGRNEIIEDEEAGQVFTGPSNRGVNARKHSDGEVSSAKLKWKKLLDGVKGLITRKNQIVRNFCRKVAGKSRKRSK